jgi:phytoene dehydrogenase-like protein
MPDSVVVGAGPNGLVAANLLADRGLDVLVLEAEADPGGAVRSAELIEPGFQNDRFSAFHVLAPVSPAFRSLQLEGHGLAWARSPLALAHPSSDGTCPALAATPEETAAILDRWSPGDGERWHALMRWWEAYGPPIVESFLGPWPPVKGPIRLLARARTELLELARFLLLPARTMGLELFTGLPSARLLAGCTAHSDLGPDQTLSGFPGLLLLLVGQDLGWPSPVGGAGALTDALVTRLTSVGGQVRCSAPVERVLVKGGRAAGVRLAGGEEITAKIVVADTGAEQLYLQLLGPEHLPAATARRISRFGRSPGTVKVDWTLDGPVPWLAEDARRAGTVHIADSMEVIADAAHALNQGRVPEQPFLLFGQYSMLDPSRMPQGKEVCWSYAHVPRDVPVDAGRFADRMELQVERLAPGFRDLIRGRHVSGSPQLEGDNANLVGGMIGGGTIALHQMLVFRPIPQMRPNHTPVAGLYLGSDATHPGGGVHGACGANAARSALRFLATTGRFR